MEIAFLPTLAQSLVLAAILAVLFLFGQLFITKGFLRRSHKKESASRQVQAKAIVLAIEKTGVYMNQQPLVWLQMQVIPENGRNFITEIREVLSSLDLDSIRSGSTVTVKYNTANIKDIVLVRDA